MDRMFKRTTAAAWLAALGVLVCAPAIALADEPLPIDHELDKYWNVEQAVPSLENPLYERKGGFEGSVHAGIVPNDSFYLPKPVGLRLAYFLTDSLSVEAGYSYLLGAESDLQKFLVCAANTQKGCVNLTDGVRKSPQLQMLSSLDLAFAPVHGKFGIFTSKLSSFDLGISAGVGMIGVKTDASADGQGTPALGYKAAGHWGAGFRFYLTRWLNIRTDYKQFLYWPESGKTFLSPIEFTLGVAFLTK